jgi:negative regulator of sigma E activity
MFAILAYIGVAASALAAAAFGLVVLLGGSAQLGKEAAVAADKALHGAPPKAAAADVSAAAKSGDKSSDKSSDKTTGTAAEPTKPATLKTSKPGKSAGKPKKRPATRSARR